MTHRESCCFLPAEEDASSGNGRKSKVTLAVVLVAIAGVVAYLLVPKKTSFDDAVKTAGLNVTSNGKLKLFDPLSKYMIGSLYKYIISLFVVHFSVLIPCL